MRAGIAVWLDRPIVECAEIAAAAEAAGFSDVWLPDHYFLRDAFAAQALMAERTSRVRLGTAVVSPLLRHPTLLASSTATIQELSGGRAVIGIGVGGFEFPTQLGFVIDRPIGLVREAVRIVRAVIRGEESDVRGRHFTAMAVVTTEGLEHPHSTATTSFLPEELFVGPVRVGARRRS